jgi:lipoate-protein ligase B
LTARDKVERPIVGITVEQNIFTNDLFSSKTEAESLGLPTFRVERGGEATWHGPGQVVAYPIFALAEGRRDVRRFLRDLEEVVIRTLAEVEVEGSRREGLTGVWIGEQKVCSMGVAFRQWVSWHGLALNVLTDPEAFQGFRPCGLEPGQMTRVADHAQIPPATLLFEVLIIKHLLDVFDLELPAPRRPGGAGAGPATPAGPGFPELPLLPS